MCYVILSDIHANYTALKAVVDATQRIAAAKRFYFLGDLLGYGPVSQAMQCMDWLRYESHIYEENGSDELCWIPGNHDEWAVTRMDRVRAEGSVTLLAQGTALENGRAADWGWFAGEVREALDQESRSLLTKTRGAGPEGLFMAFTHGGVIPDERRGTYLRPWEYSVLRKHFAPLRQMTGAGTRILFCGHTHLPYLAYINADEAHSIEFYPIKYGEPIVLEPGEWIVSPGSVSHPRDGDPRAAFVLFEPEDRTVEFRRVEYDIRPVVDALRQEKFTAQAQHDATARYLAGLDAPEVDAACAAEGGQEVISKGLLRKCKRRVEQAYDRLVHEIETGDGGEEAQHYHDKIYRRPPYDLESITKTPR